MFTGLVEETGKIIDIAKKAASIEITIRGKKVAEKAEIGDSIAVNGVCLTVTKLNGNDFTADVMFETIERSGLKRAKDGDIVNLEKSLTLTTFLGDGASLTVIDVDDNAGIFSVSLIPHTIENITVGMKKTGDFVNIETDLFGKYVEKILKFDNFENTENKGKKSNLTMEFLQKHGF